MPHHLIAKGPQGSSLTGFPASFDELNHGDALAMAQGA
jgi:hypothetical protein